jgi:hypothetical protein
MSRIEEDLFMKIEEYLQTCSDEQLKELVLQVHQLEETTVTDEQPLRTFLDEQERMANIIVPTLIYQEVARRWMNIK